jgi:uncharacterized glyoxalase superfamily protein PhnB
MASSVTQGLDDFHTITPHLVVRDAARAVAFYCRAFGAAELYRNLAPDGNSIMHAELMLGDSRFLRKRPVESILDLALERGRKMTWGRREGVWHGRSAETRLLARFDRPESA